MRILITILACLVLVGGCGGRWTAEDLEWLRQTEAMLDTITALVYEKCRPCQPETVLIFVDTVFIEPVGFLDDSVSIRYEVRSSRSFYRMPPGRWYSIEEFLEWSRRFGVGQIPRFVDSVFILSEKE